MDRRESLSLRSGKVFLLKEERPSYEEIALLFADGDMCTCGTGTIAVILKQSREKSWKI